MCAKTPCYGDPDLMRKASANGNIEYVKKCIDEGRRHPSASLTQMSSTNGPEEGRDIESKDPYYKHTALSMASMCGQKDIVRLLLDCGADIETRDRYEKTPIMHASENGYRDIVELLADHGANIEARDRFGQTPIMHSASYGHEEVTRLLAERGANIIARSAGGKTPFSVALEKGPASIVLFLASRTVMDPSISYSDIPMSEMSPFIQKTRARFWVSGMFEEIIPNIVPIYLDRATKDSNFCLAMQRDIEDLLGKNVENNGRNPIDEYRVFLKHTLKLLRSIDYTDHSCIPSKDANGCVGSRDDKEDSHPAYNMDMEL